MSNKQIVVSVSCYNNEEEVICFAKQIAEQTINKQIWLLITGNGISRPGMLEEELRKIKLDTRIIYPKRNLSYLNGCLFGIKQLEETIQFKWFLISNTDISFESNFSLQSIMSLNISERIWCLVPDIVLSSKRKQNPFIQSRPSKQKVRMWKNIQGNQIGLTVYSKMSNAKKKCINNYNSKGREGYIYTAHGSCFFITYDCFQELYKIANHIFMYGEEILVAEIAHKHDKKILYYPNCVVHHNDNSTTRHINYKLKSNYYKMSFTYFYNEFF